MTTMSDQQPYPRRSRATKLRGVRDLSAPFGKISICPAGIKIEAASEDTTSKSKSSDIVILILKTATNTGRPTMVNDHSYWSVSDERSVAEISKRKRPLLGTAAERWEVSTSRGNDTIGRNNRVLPQMVRLFGARYLPECQADMHSVHSLRHEIATLGAAAKEARS